MPSIQRTPLERRISCVLTTIQHKRAEVDRLCEPLSAEERESITRARADFKNVISFL